MGVGMGHARAVRSLAAAAVAGLLAKLAGAGINVTSIQAVAAGAGLYCGILWVKAADVRKTAKLLGAG